MRYSPKRLGALLGLVGFSGERPHPVPRWMGSDADTMQKPPTIAVFLFGFCFLCLFPFLAYLAGVPIMIELPDLKSQTRFNLNRWAEIAGDPRLAKLPDRIETDRHGHILMTPPPGFPHSDRQSQIMTLLKDLLPNALSLREFNLSPTDGR